MPPCTISYSVRLLYQRLNLVCVFHDKHANFIARKAAHLSFDVYYGPRKCRQVLYFEQINRSVLFGLLFDMLGNLWFLPMLGLHHVSEHNGERKCSRERRQPF